MSETEESNIIETVDEDGEVIRFELFDIIEYEQQEYAILLPIDDEADADDDEIFDDEMVLMRLIKDGDEYSFETIDDEEEFERVSEYIESLEEYDD